MNMSSLPTRADIYDVGERLIDLLDRLNKTKVGDTAKITNTINQGLMAKETGLQKLGQDPNADVSKEFKQANDSVHQAEQALDGLKRMNAIHDRIELASAKAQIKLGTKGSDQQQELIKKVAKHLELSRKNPGDPMPDLQIAGDAQQTLDDSLKDKPAKRVVVDAEPAVGAASLPAHEAAPTIHQGNATPLWTHIVKTLPTNVPAVDINHMKADARTAYGAPIISGLGAALTYGLYTLQTTGYFINGLQARMAPLIDSRHLTAPDGSVNHHRL